jgi:GntR family transcriptional regulator
MTIDKQGSHEPASAAAGEGHGAGTPAIQFRLDPASGVPTYRQLVQQVEQALRLGYLATGDQLPRVKDVVGSLAINPNTVLKAYRELETKGIATGRPGLGTFVQAAPAAVPLAELTTLRKSLTAWLRTASAAGLDEGGMSALFTAAMRDFLEHHARGEPPRGGAASPARQGQAGRARAGQVRGGGGPAGPPQEAEGVA